MCAAVSFSPLAGAATCVGLVQGQENEDLQAPPQWAYDHLLRLSYQIKERAKYLSAWLPAHPYNPYEMDMNTGYIPDHPNAKIALEFEVFPAGRPLEMALYYNVVNREITLIFDIRADTRDEIGRLYDGVVRSLTIRKFKDNALYPGRDLIHYPPDLLARVVLEFDFKQQSKARDPYNLARLVHRLRTFRIP